MQILGQNTGNITSQRTYIHRELGADSLRQPIPLSAGVDEARGRAWRGRNGGAETEVKIENENRTAAEAERIQHLICLADIIVWQVAQNDKLEFGNL